MNVTTFKDLQCKEVINLNDGRKLGSICDVEIDICSGNICAIAVPLRENFFSFSRAETLRVAWCDVEKIGEDIIFIRCNLPCDC